MLIESWCSEDLNIELAVQHTVCSPSATIRKTSEAAPEGRFHFTKVSHASGGAETRLDLGVERVTRIPKQEHDLILPMSAIPSSGLLHLVWDTG